MKLTAQVKKDLREFIRLNIKDWRKDAKEYGEACITFATNEEGTAWNYQTGDNSYIGGCYSLPYWSVGYVQTSTTIKELYSEIINQFDDIEIGV